MRGIIDQKNKSKTFILLYPQDIKFVDLASKDWLFAVGYVLIESVVWRFYLE